MKKRKKNFLSTKIGRILAVLIALAMIASMVIPAFAHEKSMKEPEGCPIGALER